MLHAHTFDCRVHVRPENNQHQVVRRVVHEYSDEEKKFPGFYGDMLHHLVRGSERELERELEAAGALSLLPAAGADVGAGTLSDRSRKDKVILDPSVVNTEVPAAVADVRRSDRKRKQNGIYDPSVVKPEGGDQP